MIEIENWTHDLVSHLQAIFSDKLLFVGLQGSYRRGEATESSDIDVVTVLETLSLAGLKKYREIIASMPEHEKACGFVCGKMDLYHWPRHELFQLLQDTDACYGSLAPLLPPVTAGDIANSIKIEAANLYHGVCHLYLYESADAEKLKVFYKSAFFILQLLQYQRTGEYVHTKRELLTRLNGEEQTILSISADWEAFLQERHAHPEQFFNSLLRWASEILRQSA